MPLSTVRILQVGDLHLPSVIGERRNIDDKDKSFALELKHKMSRSPTKIVYQKLYELLSEKNHDSVLFMGDLTNIGNLRNFELAAKYLAQTLQIGEGRRNSDIPVGIVSGNHDINRVLAKNPSMIEKFIPLNESLAELGLPQIPVDDEIEIDISKGNASAKIVLMNSCWGCGAKENIPVEFRSAVYSAIDGKMTDEESKGFHEYYEKQLDTPAFSFDTISRVSDARARNRDDTVEIYVAHHNLLPQRVARIASYTELVNSGAMRDILTNGERSTIYLHGHIHDDPVEIISTPFGGKLISISSPLSSEGFNEVEIVYTEAGLPMSCIIYPWRFSKSGVLQKEDRMVVSLASGRRVARDRSLYLLLSFIMNEREVFWSQIENYKPHFYDDQTQEKLQEAIEMLMAQQVISVENYMMQPQNWIVRLNL